MRVLPPRVYWTFDPVSRLLLPGQSFDWNGLRFVGGICVGPGKSSVNGGSFTDVVGQPSGNPIQFRHGKSADLPALLAGEPGFTTDTGSLVVGRGPGNTNLIINPPTVQALPAESTPAALTSGNTFTDYAPTLAQMIRLSTTGLASATISGIAGGVSGQGPVRFIVFGSGSIVVNAGVGAAGNQVEFKGGLTSITLSPGTFDTVELLYDGTSGIWREI